MSAIKNEVQQRFIDFKCAAKNNRALAIDMLRQSKSDPKAVGLVDSLMTFNEQKKRNPIDDFMLHWLEDLKGDDFVVVFDTLVKVWQKTTPARKLSLVSRLFDKTSLRCDLVEKNPNFFYQAQFIKENGYGSRQQWVNALNYFMYRLLSDETTNETPEQACKFIKALGAAGVLPPLEVLQELSSSQHTLALDAFEMAMGTDFIRNIRVCDGLSLLGRACNGAGSVAVIERLMNLGCDVHLKNRLGLSVLDIAASDGNEFAVGALVRSRKYDIAAISRSLASGRNSGTRAILESELSRLHFNAALASANVLVPSL